ncbi:hypothetical protein BH11ACT6_BH11ACT6_29840 [soil metagenome]
MKTCPVCDENKPLTEYHKNRTRSDGLQRLCKPCHRRRVAESQRRHPDTVLQYRDANRERISDKTREYRASRADLIAAKQRQRLASNPPCSVNGCPNAATAKLAGSLCQMHMLRLRKTGDTGPATYLDVTGPNSPEWTGDAASYSAAHLRTSKARGRARDHACVDCSGPAAEWSYQHGSDKELTELRSMPRGSERLVTYSPDPDDYAPRCKSCHTKYDRREANAA